jgi:ketosteroid isomerase-like protein
MDDAMHRDDEQTVRQLDQSWNDVYARNDRSAFAQILADDFCGNFSDGRPISKAGLMQPTPGPARATFSEFGIAMFGPTAVTRGRALIELPDRTIDQRFVRVYSKRSSSWQAVAVFVFPLAPQGS